MNLLSNTVIRIGDLPHMIQMDLSDWCRANRTADPLLTTVEQWPIHRIVHAWLEYNGIVACTYEFLVLMDALIGTLGKEKQEPAKSKKTR